MITALLAIAALQPQSDWAFQRLEPVDRCAADTGFAAFRAQLIEAADRRDRAFILSAIADDLLVNFGGERGREAFDRQHRLGEADSPFWNELKATLALGCVQDEGEFVSPSLGPQLAEDFDPFEALVVVRTGATLYERTDRSSPVVGAGLDWDVLLRRWIDDMPEDWVAVRHADGRQGYIPIADVRSPIDHRASFARVGGRWRITTFIAGD